MQPASAAGSPAPFARVAAAWQAHEAELRGDTGILIVGLACDTVPRRR